MKKQRNPQKMKWPYLLIVVFIIIIIVVSMYNYKNFRDQLIEKEQVQLLTIAETTADRVENYLKQLVQDEIILQRTILDEYHTAGDDLDVVFDILNHYYQIQNGRIHKIYFLDQYGDIVYETIDLNSVDDYQAPVFDTPIFAYEIVPKVTDYYQLPSGDLAVDIVSVLQKDGQIVGYLRSVVKLNQIYNDLIRDITIGEKGYVSVKDSEGILLMHPKAEDIGTNVMIARKSEYPDYDWSELENLVALQKQGRSGTGIYHSIWYHDDERRRIKKFSAYAPAYISDDFWIMTVSMDYQEIDDLAKKHFFSNSLFAGFFPVVLTILLIYIFNLKKNLTQLEKEQAYMAQLNQLNKELEEDIKERKLLEKELIKSKKRFRKLFNAGHDLNFTLYMEGDKKYQIYQVNHIACEYLGRDYDDLFETDYFEYDHLMTIGSMDQICNQLGEESHVIFESEIQTKEQIIPVEISAQRLILDGQAMLMLVARDILDKKKQEEQLEKNRGLLIYKFRMVAMGEMIANIAHQWRQPLGSLSLMLTNLKDASDHGEMTKDYFDGSVTRMKSLIQKMSDVIDEFRYFFNPNQEKAVFNPKDQIRLALDMVRDRTAIGEIEVEIKSVEDFELYGYPNQFSQVILNVLNNSIDAILDQDESGRIQVTIEKRNDKGCIIISNNGPKLEIGSEAKVFDPYFTTKKDRDGTGIGLYMTKMIIESNFYGAIEMTNTEDGVATTITLPLERI